MNKQTKESSEKINKYTNKTKQINEQMSNCHWRSASQRHVANALFTRIFFRRSFNTLLMCTLHMLQKILNGNLTCIIISFELMAESLGPGSAHDHHITTAFMAL